MIFLLDKIKEDVRVSLDENHIDTKLITDGDEDTLMLNGIIESKILEAVERVHREAPYYMLEQSHIFGNDEDAVVDEHGNVVIPAGVVAVYCGDHESGWVLLPDDFMRLVVFEMSDWERPVYAAITPADPRYARQHSRVKALRGTAQRPVCAIATRPEGGVLEFWSCKSENAYVRRAVYVPYPKIEEGNGQLGVDISERCYTAVVYMCAALTLATQGDKQSEVMFNNAKTLLQ